MELARFQGVKLQNRQNGEEHTRIKWRGALHKRRSTLQGIKIRLSLPLLIRSPISLSLFYSPLSPISLLLHFLFSFLLLHSTSPSNPFLPLFSHLSTISSLLSFLLSIKHFSSPWIKPLLNQDLISPWSKLHSSRPDQAFSSPDRLISPWIEALSLLLFYSSSSNLNLELFAIFLVMDDLFCCLMMNLDTMLG